MSGGSKDRRETGETSTPERRKQILAQGLATRLSRPGQWRVEPQADYYAIVVGGKPVNHVLHLILSLVTFGIWLTVWVFVSVARALVE